MTDRLNGFIVYFDKEIREDDAERIRQAILTLKNVIGADPIVAEYDSYIAKEQARRELGVKLWKVLYPDTN